MGCIAQGGSAATPRLLKSVTSSKGLPVAHVTTETSQIGWKTDTCDKIRTMMHNNVTSNYSKSLDFGGLNVCAKSGTAEVGAQQAPRLVRGLCGGQRLSLRLRGGCGERRLGLLGGWRRGGQLAQGYLPVRRHP